MKIKLRWVNTNTFPTKTNVYRNEVETDNSKLTTPLAVLENGITEYIDETVVVGKTYYYVLASVSGSSVVYSKSFKVDAVYSTGPGPNTLQWGDQVLGYYGATPFIDLFTGTELTSYLTFQPTIVNNLPTYHKFVRKGKILFIPNSVISTTTSTSIFTNLYKSGVVFGTNDNGPGWASTLAGSEVNQKKVITKNGFNYILRLLTGSDDTNNPTREAPAGGTLETIRKNSEVGDILAPLGNESIYTWQKMPRIGISSQNSFTNTSDVFVQEKYNTGLLNGRFGVIGPIGNTAVGAWLPILELIQDDLVIGSTV